METLPFAEQGFKLFDAADIMALTRELPLHTVNMQRLHDVTVAGGSTQLVQRNYVNLVFKKETISSTT